MSTTNPLHPLSKEVAEQLKDKMRRILVRLDEMRAMATHPNAWMPPVDLYEMENAVLAKIELPGVTIDNIRVSLLDSLLRIEGRKDRNTPSNNHSPESPIRFICMERSYGNFYFSVSLKWAIDESKISAKLASGILTIRLPKAGSCGREIVIPVTE